MWVTSFQKLMVGSSIDSAVSCLLNNDGSLTWLLQKITSNKVQFNLISSTGIASNIDGLDYVDSVVGCDFILRNIVWSYATQNIVYASSIISRQAYNYLNDAHAMDRPIGELLFADNTIARSQFEFALVTSDHELYCQMRADNVAIAQDECLIARRRKFYLLQNMPLIVTEVFFINKLGIILG